METKTKSDMCFYIPDDAFIEGAGFRVSIVKRDEPGHCPTGTWPYEGKVGQTMPYFWGNTKEEAERIAQSQNARLGLTEADVQEIIDSSMRASLKKRGRKR